MSDPQAATRDEASAHSEIGYGLADVTHLLRMAFDQRMRKMGLTTATWRVIAYLSREDGQTQAALAQRLEISRVALGETIDRLEKSGHVVRKADPVDRRKWRVHLTPRSHDLLPLMFERSEELRAECFQDLSEVELRQLESSLSRLRARLTGMKIETPDEESGTT